jgi:hypothetical protein
MSDERKGFNKFENFARISLLLIIFYVFSIQFFGNALWQLHGGSFAFTGYFWVLQIGSLLFGILLVIYYHNPISIICRFFYVAFLVFFTMRNLVPEFFEYVPVVGTMGIVIYAVLLFNLITLFVQVADLAKDKRLKLDIKKILQGRKFKFLGIFGLFWISMTGWSYFGFSYSVEVTDPFGTNESDMRVSFYGYPFGSNIYDYYNNTFNPGLWGNESQFYRNWDTTFAIPWSVKFHEPAYAEDMVNWTKMFHIWEDSEVEFMLDLGPHNNEYDEAEFFTYYYCEEMNFTIDTIVTYVESEGLTNFRGIELDPEGPKWGTDNNGRPLIINASQYLVALTSIQNKFDEVKAIHPNWQFTVSSVPTALFDWFDDDRDNDIILKSISAEPLDIDYYGFQTYMVQADTMGQCEFYEFLKIAFDHYGTKFIPWIGWLNDQIGYYEIDLPGVYESLITQVKICKSFGFDELTFAPARNVLGLVAYRDYDAYDTCIQRLHDINATINSTFSPFRVQYQQNQRLFNDLGLWIKKITPYYFSVNSNVITDLICEMQGGWLLYYEILQSVVILFVCVLVNLKKKFAKRRFNTT